MHCWKARPPISPLERKMSRWQLGRQVIFSLSDWRIRAAALHPSSQMATVTSDGRMTE